VPSGFYREVSRNREFLPGERAEIGELDSRTDLIALYLNRIIANAGADVLSSTSLAGGQHRRQKRAESP
jgi:hypothetical protein